MIPILLIILFFNRNEDEREHAFCKWEKPPENGLNFLPCSTGFCWDIEGSLKRNGTLRLTHCDPHYILLGGRGRDSCAYGEWTSRGHLCIRKL